MTSKSRTLWMVTALMALTGVCGTAADAIALKANIPFDFMVGNERIPAGEYYFARNLAPRSIELYSKDTGTLQFLLQTPAGNNKTGFRNALVFNRYGERYFLREIWAAEGMLATRLPRSRAEKEEMARLKPAKTTLTATLVQ